MAQTLESLSAEKVRTLCATPDELRARRTDAGHHAQAAACAGELQ